MLGLSGATFTFDKYSVIKIGGTTDLSQQAALCRTLGAFISPVIRWSNETDYCMERLDPLESRDYARLLVEVKELLSQYVWPRVVAGHDPQWRSGVRNWIEVTFPDIPIHLLHSLYPEFSEQPCLMHGDPTLANLMKRGDRYVLIDPVSPRHNVPSLREIDLSCLLQSAAGWENVLDPVGWPRGDFEELSLIALEGESQRTQARTYFWAAYKCARILFHNQRPDTSIWARMWLQRFLHKAVDCL